MLVKGKKIAFVVGTFPVISETWLINQVVGLKKRGIDVEIFSFTKGNPENVSEKFHEYTMAEYIHYLDMPENKVLRFFVAIPKVFHLLIRNPTALIRALNFRRYGWQAASLETLFWAESFVGKDFDLVHCHFGTVATKFMEIRYILGLKNKIITSFYGMDVSRIFKAKDPSYYDEVKKWTSQFIVMSEFMKKRVVAQGFDERKIHVVPIFGIDVNDYVFKERILKPGETIQMGTVGRFVEKKGFDDLLRALAIVKQKTDKKFNCTIIGDGPLRPLLETMTKELDIGDVVTYTGYMKQEEMINRLQNMHLYLQSSKTAADGDME